VRIVFLAVDDEFAGEMQRFVYEAHPEWVVGSVISSVEIYKHTRITGLLFVLRQSGPMFLAQMVRMKILKALVARRSRFFPSKLAEQHSVEQFITANINDPESVRKLQNWKPDLIISTNFSHYIGKTVRESIARSGCWNLHKSLLPHYRGMAPAFHALLEGATSTGVTLHVVTQSFDAGAVLAQQQIPVRPTDSVYCLNRKSSEVGGRMLASFLETFDPASTVATPQPVGAWKYYTYPSRLEVQAFVRKGLKFINSEAQE
jgi:folate-dependent phosphoribosylglycinamide formyltransferase PurN